MKTIFLSLPQDQNSRRLRFTSCRPRDEDYADFDKAV